MATLIRTFSCTKDNTSRVTDKKGQGASDWLMIGRTTTGNVHRVYLDFSGFDTSSNWNVGDKIVKIELVITTSDTHNISFGSKPGIRVGRMSGSWAEGNAPDGSWHTDDYRNVAANLSPTHFWLPAPGVENDHIFLDITDLMEPVVPTRVLRRNGTPGGGGTFSGLKLVSENEAKDIYRTEIWGRGAATAGNRPYLRVTYDVGTASPNAPTLGSPEGTVNPGFGFNGAFTSNQDTDVLNKVEIRVWKSNGTTQVGSTIVYSATDADRATATFSVPMPTWIASGVTYGWDARVFDQTGAASAWAAKKYFKLSSSIPVVVLTAPAAPLATLRNYLFRAVYSDADGDDLRIFRCQVRLQTGELDPTWGDALLWDGGPFPPTGPDNEIAFAYGGPPLSPDTAYSMRVRVQDASGSVSEWDYADFSTTADYVTEPEEEHPDWSEGIDETPATLLTGYNKSAARWRIVLKAMGTNRGPGSVVAIITDPLNVGASVYANSPGEMFFTIPAEHPQIGECEPYQRHYSVQRYIGDQWVEKFAGILDDFDATEDEVVFHGVDYLGLLSFAVDERRDGTKAVVLNPPGTGGSKYSETDISVIIRDQLYQAKNQSSSPLGFITIPTNATADWSAMSEKVSLATPYSPLLGTIMGLMESHKAGTGRRSRLLVKRTGENAYKWQLFDNYGKDRPEIRLAYGGLVNGYRLVGFGDFGTVVLGLGRQREGVKVLYAEASSTLTVEGTPIKNVFGRISKTAVWQDLYDETDLRRRVKERAERYAKIGKRTALALRVDGLAPLDGYDVMDSVPVVINRGPVQTDRYGSGLWTIHGVAWKLYADGHEDITLTVMPKEDGVAISGDIVGSSPLLPGNDWQIGWGIPTTPYGTVISMDRAYLMDAGFLMDADDAEGGLRYLDAETGIIYMQDDQGDWVVAGSPPKPEPPGVVIVDGRNTLNADGTAVANLNVRIAV